MPTILPQRRPEGKALLHLSGNSGYTIAMENFRLTCDLAAPAHQVWHTWLDNAKHEAMSWEGEFSVGDCVTGVTTELEKGKRIVQTWRTTDFEQGQPDSTIEVLLEDLPDDQTGQYRQGWGDYYFQPRQKYFGPREG